MKLVHVIYDHPKNPWLGGGGAVRAFLINEGLAAQGEEVHMVCGGFPGCQQTENPFPVHFTPAVKSYPVSRLLFSLFVAKVTIRLKPDIVVDDASCYSPSFMVFFPKFLRIGMNHGLNGPSAKRKFPIIGHGIAAYEKWNLKKAHHLIAVSPSTEQTLWEWGRGQESTTLIPAGVYQPVIEPKSEEQRTEDFLFMGRLETYHKGLDLLADFWKSYHVEFPASNLLIAGNGKDEEDIKTLFDGLPRVVFLGRIEKTEKEEWLSKSKLFLMPSRYEGWGIVALEAMAYGTPVIGSDIDGLREAMDEGGVLLENYSAEAMKKAIDQTKKKGSWSSLSAKAKQISKKYQWEDVVEKTSRCYHSLLEKN